VRSEGFYVKEKSTDTSWDRTSDLPIVVCHNVTNIFWSDAGTTHLKIIFFVYSIVVDRVAQSL